MNVATCIEPQVQVGFMYYRNLNLDRLAKVLSKQSEKIQNFEFFPHKLFSAFFVSKIRLQKEHAVDRIFDAISKFGGLLYLHAYFFKQSGNSFKGANYLVPRRAMCVMNNVA